MKTIDTVYDMDNEEDLKKFAKYLEEDERTIMKFCTNRFMIVLSFSSRYFANFLRSSSLSMSYTVSIVLFNRRNKATVSNSLVEMEFCNG